MHLKRKSERFPFMSKKRIVKRKDVYSGGEELVRGDEEEAKKWLVMFGMGPPPAFNAIVSELLSLFSHWYTNFKTLPRLVPNLSSHTGIAFSSFHLSTSKALFFCLLFHYYSLSLSPAS